MTDDQIPVLWLYGPSGVGKTTVAWQLFQQLTANGGSAGYVDIDQLGMCYAAPTPDNWAPEPASDPGRHRIEARNLDGVVANFQAAGARCVVVSGVVDPARGADADLVPHAALTSCRMRAEPAALRQRLSARGRETEDIEEILRYGAALDRNHPSGLCVDTTGRNVTEVLELVRKQTPGWPGTGPSGAPDLSRYAGTGQILWLCGATAVGKSTVGWQVYQRVRQAGFRAAYLDLDQVGFHRPVPAGDPGNHRLKAANLAAVWRTYHAAGAPGMVIVGPVDSPEAVRRYAAALPAATITLCRLHAEGAVIAERVMSRGQGWLASWDIPGDALRGQPVAVLRRVADRAAAEAQALERSGVGDLRVGTDGRPPPAIAEEVLARTGWPDRRLR